ncbi:serine protease [Burkholderia cepacia]|uniref:S1 family peptidase n=1 Tax=Burkholderia cepacia TaxID=292 RepID=UPI000F595817|nr:serine protease [Burkholderia cepacia]RQU90551.1 serine protease [Burkholderia cenocepacia]RQV30296.1 serine protease [Burkholderia cenocepacia]RQV88874.1 serine protease [Burkholderia cenocepacia]RQZ91015.1 serine protease [Burkholderia cepacia]RQZ98386.1 serine protease [Burkholderia cenocepacia]
MLKPPLSDTDAEAMASFVEPYICSIQYIPKNDTRQPPGNHHGTGWLFDADEEPCIVTCEHVARWQKHGHLGYSCFGDDNGISIEGKFVEVFHPVDAAIATVRNSYRMLPHNGQCVPRSLFANSHAPVQGELLYAYGFPGADAKQLYETQIVQGTAVFLRQVDLDAVVYKEVPPHPDPDRHICLAWSPEHALAMLGTSGSLSLPNGMSGSLLWNTRYEEITRSGGKWSPADACITGMIWGHSAKASQLYATPIEVLVHALGL